MQRPDASFALLTASFSNRGLINPSEPTSKSFAAGLALLMKGPMAFAMSDAELTQIFSSFKAHRLLR